MAAQIYSGLDGMAKKLDLGPSADAPYETKAELLPKNLGEALASLRQDVCFRAGFGQGFLDYCIRIKEAELARFRAEAGVSQPQATEWEQKEYFDLF